MSMTPSLRARFVAGAIFLAALAAPAAAERVRIAAERGDGACPGGEAPTGLVRGGASAGPCLALFAVSDLSDATLAEASSSLSRLSGARGGVLDFGPALAAAPADWETRMPFALKSLASAIRSQSPEAFVAVALPEPGPQAEGFTRIVLSEELRPYVDALAAHPGQTVPAETEQRLWILTPRPAEATAVAAALTALAAFPASSLVAVTAAERPLSEEDLAALGRLQRYLTADVSRDPTTTRLTLKDGAGAASLRFFDAKTFTPILLLPGNPAGEARLELPEGTIAKASVENLASGVRRDFEVKGARALTLDLSKGPLAVVLHPAARKGGETKAEVAVGAVRGLTADEIIARQRAWDAGQREKFHTYTASMNTSLRFRVAELQSTLELSILGPFFYERGKPSDWAWDEFFLNGVKWKGRTIPKLPILQPEKVTTLPLDIRLSEEYRYELAGETTLDGRPAYRVDFRPISTQTDKAIYRGTAWIDRETFALLRRESIQLNLKGDTLSNIQTEYYQAVPSRPEVVLPLEIRGQQVFSTAGRVTAIERYVVMSNVVTDPSDFASRLEEAYASKRQMVRDTDDGLRYLVPDPSAPTERLVENKLSRKSLFGLVGAFYQRSSDYPFPLLGVQYFNFDMWGKNKQLSVFFAGAILFGNYTDPSLFGSRWDLGVDVFGVAFPFVQESYRDGELVESETIKQLPEFLQVNVGRPIGPYLKASLGLFSQWDNFQRDKDTGPLFVTPVDTFTNGAEARLTWNQSGYNIAAKAGFFDRAKWQPWGDPATSGYNPDQKNYWKYSVELNKGFFFENYRKLGVSVSYLDGQDLDRFSQWDFGPFGTTQLSGFPTGAVRADRAVLANLSYGLNIENLVRFEIYYDQALVTELQSGYHNTYFSGVGLQTAFNGPWDNTRIRAEVGYPVVANGVKGLTLNLQLLKVF
jgi:hypothetical protein